MYLTQMGEIPLLTRKEEIRLARKIEITRAAFRRKLLCMIFGFLWIGLLVCLRLTGLAWLGAHDPEIVSTIIVLLNAGHEATVNTLGNGVLALLRHREQWERLAEGVTFDGMESWLPWLTEGEHGLFDVLGPTAQIVLVDPAGRGQGLGHRLVGECIAFAKACGYRRITLWTQSILVAARKIYQEAGFKLVATEPHRSFGHELVGEYWEMAL